jgi:hypothetical protein
MTCCGTCAYRIASGADFESDFRCEIVAKGQQLTERKKRTVKLWSGVLHSDTRVFKYAAEVEEDSPVTIRISRPLGKHNTVKDLQTNWLASLYALNLVCKQVHAETLKFVYHKTEFVFDAPSRVTSFVAILSNPRLQDITKLQLHYTTYGCPKWNKDRIWQDKHSESWMRACKVAAKKFTGLQELKIWMMVNDEPLRLNLRQNWITPLLQFRRLTGDPKLVDDSVLLNPKQEQQRLEVVGIHFRTRLLVSDFGGNQELAKANKDLHCLFGQAIQLAILGAKEEEALADFNDAWKVKHALWQFHLNFAETGW